VLKKKIMLANENIAKIITHIFVENSSDTAIIDAKTNTRISYNQLFFLILQSKKKLISSGIKPGYTIILLMDNSLELLVLYFASLLLELTVIPIDPQKSPSEIDEILSCTTCKTLITNTTCPQNILSQKKVILWTPETPTTTRAITKTSISLWEKIDYEKPFLITFTSGSTGKPKGVIHSFKSIAMSALAFNEKFNFNQKNIFYHNLPMTYMAGILNLIFLPFLCNSKIVIGPRFSISEVNTFWKPPINHKVNTFWFIPTIISLLLRLDRGNSWQTYSKKQSIIGCVGTAPLFENQKQAFEKKYNIPLYESYGLSETLFVTTSYPNHNNLNTPGTPLKSVSLDFSEEKEILIKTPWISLGYHNQPKTSMNDCYFQSGDMGKFDTSGNMKITGRLKNIIIRGGINISPHKIESILSRVAKNAECVIIGEMDNILGEKNSMLIHGKYKQYEQSQNRSYCTTWS